MPHTPNIKIEAYHGSREALLSLLLDADPSEAMLDRYWAQSEVYVLLADGVIACEAVITPVDDTVCELKNLCCHPDYRGRGYASRLVRTLLSRYAARYRTMLVGTAEPGASFYERLGFRIAYRIPEFFTENYPEPLFDGGVQCIDMVCLTKALDSEEELNEAKPFEFDGEKYKRASRHQKEWGTRLILGLKLQGNESILDLGCGDGALTEQLAALVTDGQVLGIDASDGMIQTAMQRKRSNLRFLRQNIGGLNADSEYDIIFSNAALHWVHDHKRLLQNCYKALKPGGSLAWNFAGEGTCSAFFEVLQRTMEDEAYRDYFNQFQWPWYMPGLLEYRQLFQESPFSEATVTEEQADRYFAGAGEMTRWIDQPSIVPFLAPIPTEKQESFRRDVVQAMLQKTLQPDGTCFETFRRIKVTATK